MPLMVDPGLYLTTKSNIFWVSPRRALPTAFKLFTGQYYLKKAVFVLYGCRAFFRTCVNMDTSENCHDLKFKGLLCLKDIICYLILHF